MPRKFRYYAPLTEIGSNLFLLYRDTDSPFYVLRYDPNKPGYWWDQIENAKLARPCHIRRALAQLCGSRLVGTIARKLAHLCDCRIDEFRGVKYPVSL